MQKQVSLTLVAVLFIHTIAFAQGKDDRTPDRSITIGDARGVFTDLSASHIRLSVYRAARFLGTVEYTNFKNETITTTIETPLTTVTVRDVEGVLSVTYGERTVVVSDDEEARAFLSEIGSRVDIQELAAVTPGFLDRIPLVVQTRITSLLPGPEPPNTRLECANKIFDCLFAAGAYVGGIFGLISLCGGTKGWSGTISRRTRRRSW